MILPSSRAYQDLLRNLKKKYMEYNHILGLGAVHDKQVTQFGEFTTLLL